MNRRTFIQSITALAVAPIAEVPAMTDIDYKAGLLSWCTEQLELEGQVKLRFPAGIVKLFNGHEFSLREFETAFDRDWLRALGHSLNYVGPRSRRTNSDEPSTPTLGSLLRVRRAEGSATAHSVATVTKLDTEEVQALNAVLTTFAQTVRFTSWESFYKQQIT